MRLFLPRLLELHILSQLFPPALPHSPWWWSGNVPWCPTHTSDCTQSIQTTERALAADSLYPKTASIEWYSFIHRQCHVTPPTPNTPKKKLTLTFCHQISLLLKKNKRNSRFQWSYLPFDLSNSTVPQKMDEISGPATLNPPHPYNAADHKAEFPARRKTKGFSHVRFGGSWATRTWDGKIGNHRNSYIFFQSSSCLWEGRVPTNSATPPWIVWHVSLGKLWYTCENKSHSYSYGTRSILHVYAGIGLSPQTTLL